MKKMKKILCFLLVFAMTFGCMSGRVSAATGTRPEDGVTENQPFDAGTGGSNMFRIPCLVTLDDGTIVAGCDARWTTYADGGGLDTIVSYSKDNGATWHYTFANYLGDNGNVWNGASTAFIDPAMATDGKTIWMIADLYPAGIGLNGANYGPQTGHTGYDENGNLALAAATDSVNGNSTSSSRAAAAFNYHLEKIADAAENAESYYQLIDADGNAVEGYTVDAYFNIKGDGVDTNLFCGDSPYFPYPTDFLYMTSSKDGGATWSIPTLLDLKDTDEQTLLVGPGRGMVTSEGRIIFTAYEFTSGDKFSCTLYSDDNGKTWHRGADVSGWSSEAVVTEADGRLYMFTRHGNAYYVSNDWGETWGPQLSTGLSYNSNCQLTAITYSEKIDGKTAILFAAPSNTSSRTNGKIFVGLVQEDESIEWVEEFNVCENGAAYAYSCLAETADGDIALLWEFKGAGIRFDLYTMDEVLGKVKNLTMDPGEQYVEEKTAEAAAEITVAPDESVATATSEFVVEDSTTLLYDHTSNTEYSLSSFSTTANVSNSLTSAELVLTNVDGNVYKAYNTASGKYACKGASAYVNLVDSADDSANQIVLEPTTAEDGTVTYKLYRASDSARYTIFYNTNMDFNTNGGYNSAWTGPSTNGDYGMVLLEKQESVSDDDIIPGYKRAAAITSGNTYIISYIWDNASNADDPVNGSVFILDPNGTSTGDQTKLVGDTVNVAKSVVTITAVAPGETTAVVGDVTYNITVNDPTTSPTYTGNDVPVDSLVAISDSQYTPGTSNEGPDDYILDGDANTHWHTNWSTTEATDVAKRWVGVSLSEATAVDGIRYLPRNNGGTNGAVTEYEVQYRATDDGEWITVASGNLNYTDTSWQLIKFDAVMAKQVRIVGVHTYADSGNDAHMSCAEFRVLKASGEVVAVDKTELEAAIAAAEALNADDYKDFTAVEAALAEAKAVAENENATQTAVDAATEALNAAVAALEENEVVRIAGAGRIDTALEVADTLKDTLGLEKFDSVIIATSKTFADALPGSYLAYVENAPILLISDARMDDVVAYVKANLVDGGKVYILGGEAAVSASLEGKLEGYAVDRLAGSGRYETNMMILDRAGVTGGEIIVATGKSFADSLSASAAKLPILMVKDALNADQKALLATMNVEKFYIVGGESAVSAKVADELADYASVERVAGANRRETSIAVAKKFFENPDMAVVASASNFPDGLCGGPLAAALNAPLVLTVDGKTTEAAAYTAELGIEAGYVLGGTGVLTDDSVVNVFAMENAEDIVVK